MFVFKVTFESIEEVASFLDVEFGDNIKEGVNEKWPQQATKFGLL